MSGFHIFIIRAIMGAAFGVVLVRMFFPEKPILYGAGLGLFLVGMAYVFEYLRQKKQSK